MAIERAFGRTAAYYDDWVRQAIPGYDTIFSTAVELVPFPADAALRVLDLGAGTGLFSELVSRSYARAHFVLYDLSEELLALAEQRFADRAERFRYVRGDYTRLAEAEAYHLVISSLSIHHLEHAQKRDLFGAIWRALVSGGAFINVDQIRAPTPELERMYWNDWLDKLRRAGADEERLQESIERRRTWDRDASLAEQLAWLEQAGFEDVDCVYKNYFVGVFFATKR